jgi:predicted nucleic acid-binding protein
MPRRLSSWPKAERIEFLRLVGRELVVPSAVASEIQAFGAEDVAAQALAATPWLQVVETPPVPARIQAWDLGPGESAVLAWCHSHPGAMAIIDDLEGRRCAAAFQIPVRGTLGLILLAKKSGQIPAARPVAESMRRSGMFLSDRVLNRALAMVGE